MIGRCSPELAHTYFNWEIEPGRVHLIEAVALAMKSES